MALTKTPRRRAAGGMVPLWLLAACAPAEPVTDDTGRGTPDSDVAAEDTALPPEERDRDMDGVPAAEDCDDLDPRRAPGLSEMCDGVDNDCDPTNGGVARMTWFPAGGPAEDGFDRFGSADADTPMRLDEPGRLALCGVQLARALEVAASTAVDLDLMPLEGRPGVKSRVGDVNLEAAASLAVSGGILTGMVRGIEDVDGAWPDVTLSELEVTSDASLADLGAVEGRSIVVDAPWGWPDAFVEDVTSLTLEDFEIQGESAGGAVVARWMDRAPALVQLRRGRVTEATGVWVHQDLPAGDVTIEDVDWYNAQEGREMVRIPKLSGDLTVRRVVGDGAMVGSVSGMSQLGVSVTVEDVIASCSAGCANSVLDVEQVALTLTDVELLTTSFLAGRPVWRAENLFSANVQRLAVADASTSARSVFGMRSSASGVIEDAVFGGVLHPTATWEGGGLHLRGGGAITLRSVTLGGSAPSVPCLDVDATGALSLEDVTVDGCGGPEGELVRTRATDVAMTWVGGAVQAPSPLGTAAAFVYHRDVVFEGVTVGTPSAPITLRTGVDEDVEDVLSGLVDTTCLAGTGCP